jgi:DNA-binding MarR family transcriptional regulator
MSNHLDDNPAVDHVERVADRLHSASIHLLRRVRRRDEESGVTAPHLSALSVLVFGGARTLGELAEAEQVRPPSITRIVRNLEADGLVEREPDPADRRIVRVRATEKGRRISDLAARLRGVDASDLETLERAAELIERVVR